jgi:mono/diheme cytochrome c family protein
VIRGLAQLAGLGALVLAAAVSASTRHQITERPAGTVIPKTWDDEALASMDVPLAVPSRSPVHVSSDFYYRIPVRKIYKQYPLYVPGKEPPGYIEGLRAREPEEITFDFDSFKTDAEWIAAGRVVFDAGIGFGPRWGGADVRDPGLWAHARIPTTPEGAVPFVNYVVRQRGQVEIADAGCVLCHTRLMPDGTVLRGAQGNNPADRVLAYTIRQQRDAQTDKDAFLAILRRTFARGDSMPWLNPDPADRIRSMSIDDIMAALDGHPPGVITRRHTSLVYSSQIPDLIGLRDRRYFDHTGLVRHRSIGDLMRYAALVQGMDRFDRFGDFSLADTLPDPSTLTRYSDAQLYALARYLYSLEPPRNPNPVNDLSRAGERVFQTQGCATCHTPPLYTNNKLTPAEGFMPSLEALATLDVHPVSVRTDTNTALRGRKGTGYYKVPSLKGVWYRGPFEHNGSVATLEDWFDARRLDTVKGHPFGLRLSPADKRALIAFLRTL